MKSAKKNNIKGEIGVVGGSAMVLAYRTDRATKDVDAVFEPSSAIRRAAQQISTELQKYRLNSNFQKIG